MYNTTFCVVFPMFILLFHLFLHIVHVHYRFPHGSTFGDKTEQTRWEAVILKKLNEHIRNERKKVANCDMQYNKFALYHCWMALVSLCGCMPSTISLVWYLVYIMMPCNYSSTAVLLESSFYLYDVLFIIRCPVFPFVFSTAPLV